MKKSGSEKVLKKSEKTLKNFKYLIVVESPTKANTLSKFLDKKDYIILPTVGHFKQLTKKNGVDLNTFDVKYDYLPTGKKNIDKIIKYAALATEKIYLASDPDREGEAIAYHVYEELKDKGVDVDIKRIVFHEITKRAINEAISSAGDINIALVNAQKTRSVLDYLVGFTLSPLLWSKMPGCKSAGRVQSWMLKFICDREQEIHSFIKREYWEVNGAFSSEQEGFKGVNYVLRENKELESSDSNTSKKNLDNQVLSKGLKIAKLSGLNDKKPDKMFFNSMDVVKDSVSGIGSVSFKVVDLIRSKRKSAPTPPFITSTLQQAGYKISMSARDVMRVAQKLYEDGLITYMRTDSTMIAKEKLEDIKKLIINKFGDKYSLKSYRVFKKKVKNSQEAHEAIRPTDIFLTPEKTNLKDKSLKLYELIWQQAIASQMKEAEYDILQLVISGGIYKFNTSYTSLCFEGFYKVYGDKSLSGQVDIGVRLGDVLYLKEVEAKQCFTQPPNRFSEGSIIKSMEELGIGRPSTYAGMLSKLQERGYVDIRQRRITPSRNGRLLSEFLKYYFSKYIEDSFTAGMEEDLDKISLGDLSWRAMLEGFWGGFDRDVNRVKEVDPVSVLSAIESGAMSFLPLGDKCSECKEGSLQLWRGRIGMFIRCDKYPDCKARFSIDAGDFNKTSSDEVVGSFHGEDIVLKEGRFGKYIESKKNGKVVRCSLKVLGGVVDERIACKFLDMPIHLCSYKDQPVLLSVGRYGVYVKIGDVNHKIPKGIDWKTLNSDNVIDVVLGGK